MQAKSNNLAAKTIDYKKKLSTTFTSDGERIV
jgi:hypothetical protein